MSTRETISVLNRLQQEGVIARYAIGGAFGALFYLEPTQTEDIDVFIHLSVESESALVTLEPVHRRLQELGYIEWDLDKPVVAGWPVQFLPVASPLEEEALAAAVRKEIADGEATFVFTAEHLMAMALSLGRAKDKLRLYEFWRQQAYDDATFRGVLERHGLSAKWEALMASFPQE